jgi:GNAT superfamily N-acetyltransferase
MTAARLTFRPVSKRTKDDFVAVFAGPGGPKYCWCMAWRATKAELRDTSSAAREQQMLGRINDRVPVGLVGYAEGEPVAWVSIAPKRTFQRLGGPETEENEKVWSLTCMYLRRHIRREGHAHALIDAAIEHAKKNGATVLEAYPVAPDSPSYRFMGFVPAFEKAGFEEIGTAGTRRHVMRLTLKPNAGAKA